MKSICLSVSLVVLACSAAPRAMAAEEPHAAASLQLPATTGTVHTVDAGETNDVAELPGIGEPSGVSSAGMAVSDPIEPVNRAFFFFNDKLYFWVLRPVAKGYAYVLPQTARRGVYNFFANLAMPIRLGNNLLQGEFTGAWTELERFGINTTVGVVGFDDPAKRRWGLYPRHGDFGQTLGRYGLGPSFYIDWPVIGPLSARDSVGYVGDICLDPVTYLVPQIWPDVGVKAYDTVNDTSLRPGEYERFKQAAIDPYLSLRDAYYQYRRHLVEASDRAGDRPTESAIPFTPR